MKRCTNGYILVTKSRPKKRLDWDDTVGMHGQNGKSVQLAFVKLRCYRWIIWIDKDIMVHIKELIPHFEEAAKPRPFLVWKECEDNVNKY